MAESTCLSVLSSLSSLFCFFCRRWFVVPAERAVGSPRVCYRAAAAAAAAVVVVDVVAAVVEG